MALKSNGLNNKFRTTLDLQLENKLSLIDGWINNPISYSIDGFTLILNYSKFILNGIIYEETGGVSFTIDEPEEEDRVDIIVIKENIDTFSPLNSTDTFNTIKSVEYVYKKGTQAVGNDETLFIKIEIPITALSLEDCTITTLNKTRASSELLQWIEDLENRVSDLEETPTIPQELLDLIQENADNIQDHEQRIAVLENTPAGSEFENEAILKKIRQKDLDQIKHNVDNIVKLKIDLSKEILFRNVMQDATWEYLGETYKPLSEFSDLFIDTLESGPNTVDYETLNGCLYDDNYKDIVPSKYVNLYSQVFPNLYEEKWKLFQDAPLNGGKVYAVTQTKKIHEINLDTMTATEITVDRSEIDSSTDAAFIGVFYNNNRRYYYIPCEKEFKLYTYDMNTKKWYDETPSIIPDFYIPRDSICYIDVDESKLIIIITSGENKGRYLVIDIYSKEFFNTDFPTHPIFEGLREGYFLYTYAPTIDTFYILDIFNSKLYEIVAYLSDNNTFIYYTTELQLLYPLDKGIMFYNPQTSKLYILFGDEPYFFELDPWRGSLLAKQINNYPDKWLTNGFNKEALNIVVNYNVSKIYFYRLRDGMVTDDNIYMLDLNEWEILQQQDWSFETIIFETSEVLDNVYTYIQYFEKMDDGYFRGVQFSRDGGTTWSNIVGSDEIIDISNQPEDTNLKLRFLFSGDVFVTCYVFGGGNNLIFE